MRKPIGQNKVYDFLVDYITTNLYSPSIRDICDGCGYKSTSTVQSHLISLERRGLIALENYGSPRCIKLVGYKMVKEKQ